MAALGRLGKLAKPFAVQNKQAVPVFCRAYAAAWNKDWRPGPYPKTAAERAAAAKKYGLRPEDYKVTKDLHKAQGDYPDLPIWSGNQKSYWEHWDMPEIKRNFGEPMHEDYDNYTEDRLDPTQYDRYKNSTLYLVFFGFFGSCFGLNYFMSGHEMHDVVMPKQYPFTGEKHYTFETVE